MKLNNAFLDINSHPHMFSIEPLGFVVFTIDLPSFFSVLKIQKYFGRNINDKIMLYFSCEGNEYIELNKSNLEKRNHKNNEKIKIKAKNISNQLQKLTHIEITLSFSRKDMPLYKIENKQKEKEALKNLDNILNKYFSYQEYKELYGFLDNLPFKKESYEEVANPDLADEIGIENPEISESNTMCKKGEFEGFKILIGQFWNYQLSEKESEWIDKKYLLEIKRLSFLVSIEC